MLRNAEGGLADHDYAPYLRLAQASRSVLGRVLKDEKAPALPYGRASVITGRVMHQSTSKGSDTQAFPQYRRLVGETAFSVRYKVGCYGESLTHHISTVGASSTTR
jgi:hypothetical protein